MSARWLNSWVASFSLAFAITASGAPARHKLQHHETSGAALVVRGDQVSTEGLVDAVARAFAATGDGHLLVTPFNTIDGIDQALAGSVDIAASARPAYPKRSRETGLVFTPVAWDALVLITNASNPVDNLTLRQVHEIYYGKIRNWSSLGGRDEPIDLDGVASPLDGVQFSFRRLMFGNGNNPVAVPRLFINIDSLQSEVSLDTKALALSTLAHARRQKGIKIIPIEGVRPSLASLENGRYLMPLTIYLAHKADSPKLAAIRKFLAFLGGSRAGAILRSHDLLPYAQATSLNAKEEADRINAISARMLAEGLPSAYSPGYEFTRLEQKYPILKHAVRAQRMSAAQVAEADQRMPPGAAAKADPSQPTTVPAPRRVDYTVASGDTLSKIAQKYSVSVEELRRWNDLHGDTLQVGQVLQIVSTAR
ncbi:MAG TPA: substrate-binding domain-containing protein [Rhodanobacteraceae bacterium]|nr:substrate-binding domain-containing protein [Rhodanobacteraceae bacterium]